MSLSRALKPLTGMTGLQKISLVFLLILLLLVGSVTALLGTASGLHLLINSAARWVPGLEISQVSGGWRDLVLQGVRYRMPGVDVQVGRVALGLDLSCLKQSSLCINQLETRDVNVVVNTHQLPPATDAPPSEPWGRLHTAYPLILRSLQLQNTQVKIDDDVIALTTLTSGAEWRQSQFTLLPTQIDQLKITLGHAATSTSALPENKTPPTVTQQPPKPTGSHNESLAATLNALFAKPLLPELPQITVPLDITIQDIRGTQWQFSQGQPKQGQLSGDTSLQLDRIHLQGESHDNQLTLTTLELSAPQGSLALTGRVMLEKAWPLQLNASIMSQLESLKGQKAEITLQGALQQQLQLGVKLSGLLTATLEAKTELTKPDLPLVMTLESRSLRWPLTGDAEYQAQDLRLRLNGRASAYALSLRAALQGKDLPTTQLTLDGKGGTAAFTLTRLRLVALQGNSDLSGVVDWQKAISWNAALTLNGINTNQQWPEWPARVEGKITTRGSLHGGNWQLQFPSLNLTGSIKQHPIALSGSLSGNAAGQWQIPGVSLELGNNRLQVRGELAKQWNLDATINAPRLDGLLPGLGGTLRGDLTLRGRQDAPQIQTQLMASALQWQDLHIEQINFKGNLQSAQQLRGELALRLQGLKQSHSSTQITTLTVEANGNEQQHQLRLAMSGTPVAAQLALNGRFDRQQQRWMGTLNNTQFSTPVGEWRLSRAVTLDYRHLVQQLTIGTHCWQNPHAEICVPNNIEVGASGRGTLLLNRFDLAMLQPLLNEDTQLHGGFSGRTDFSWQANGGLPQGTLSLVGSQVKIEQQIDDTVLPVAFDEVSVTASLRNQQALLGWRVKLSQNGDVTGQVHITDPQGRRALSGNVGINNISLALLKPLLVSGEKASGMINSTLQLGGSLANPRVQGQFNINEIALSSHQLPVELVNSHLGIRFNGTNSTLEGVLNTSNGSLTLTGDADWSQLSDWRARIAAKGDKLRVTLPPMVRLDLNTDLLFEATPRQLALNGKVDIPWARITVKELPESAVNVSRDEVMLDDQRKPIDPRNATPPISTNLRIHVGNDVSLNAFGLYATLSGDLTVRQDQQGPGVHGQINIPSGKFRAYGQDLIVNKGILSFSGPPDRPALNIEAVRNPDSTQNNVTAGLRVTGMADSPRIDVFSDPAMTQQEALSYILTGHGLTPGSDSGLMTSMLIGMGVAQSGQLVGKIGEAFGVSDLALDTKGAGETSQVVVSGYVLPDLQVLYGVGIFDSLATLTLRYRLMPRLYLEAVSGLDQALDLLYQFEF